MQQQYINPRGKLLYHFAKLSQIRNGKPVAPINLEIDLSNRCSHGCSWCHFAFTHTRGPLANKHEKPEGFIGGGDLMDTDLAFQILKQVQKCSILSVTWSGGGEPTLHPDIKEIVERTGSLGIDQGMYTHGGHLEPDLAEILTDNLTWIYVSLDEVNRNKFKQSKGVDRFDRVIEGIGLLNQARKSADSPCTLGLGMLLHRGNIDDIEQMVGLAEELDVDYVQFRPVINFSHEAPDQLIDDTAWVNQAILNLRPFQTHPKVQVDLGRFEMYRDWSGKHGYETCYWSALQMVITPNGSVWRCTNTREQPESLLGDLNVSSLEEIIIEAGSPCQVTKNCRIMCRGHIANLTLQDIMLRPHHPTFI